MYLMFEIKVYLNFEFKFLSQMRIEVDTDKTCWLELKVHIANKFKLSQAIEIAELAKD